MEGVGYMKNYGKFLLVFLLIIILGVFGGCDLEDVINDDGDLVELDEPMDPKFEEFLASLPEFNIDEDLIVFDDGETFGEYYKKEMSALSDYSRTKRKEIIGSMVTTAKYLCNKDHEFGNSSIPKPGGQSNYGTGLAYIWGGKKISTPLVGVGGAACTTPLYGLDCSGLVYQCQDSPGFKAKQGSTRIRNSAYQSTEAYWNEDDANEILSSNNLIMKRIPVDSPPQTGDILAWGNPVYHIGIAAVVANANGTKIEAEVVYQSNGNKPLTCEENSMRTRGCNKKSYAAMTQGWGKEQYRLRIIAKLSGEWNFFLRCNGQARDAVVFKFVLNEEVDKTGKIDVTSDGVDYDGSTFTATINGNYDLSANVISGIISYVFHNNPSGRRSDSFTVSLDTDTSYFPLAKEINNNGCYADGRLERVKEQEQLPAQQEAINLPSNEIPDCGIGYCKIEP